MLNTYYIMDVDSRISELNQRDPRPVPLNVGDPFSLDPDYGGFRGTVIFESIREIDLGDGLGLRTTTQLIDLGRAPDVLPDPLAITGIQESWSTLVDLEKVNQQQRERARLNQLLADYLQAGPAKLTVLAEHLRMDRERLRKFLNAEGYRQVKKGLWGL